MVTKKRQNLTGQWRNIVFGIVVLFGAAYLSWWSYIQSQRFLVMFDGAVESVIPVSYVFAAVVQYGQSIVLWLGLKERKRIPMLESKVEGFKKQSRQKDSSQKDRISKLLIKYEGELNGVVASVWAWIFLYGLFLIIDIFSNIGQFLSSANQLEFLAKSVGILGVILVAFVEEIMPGVLTAIGDAFNDIREANGKKRLTSLDGWREEVIEEISSSQTSNRQGGSRKKNTSTNSRNSKRTFSKLPKSAHSQRDSNHEPTYHPVDMRAGLGNEEVLG